MVYIKISTLIHHKNQVVDTPSHFSLIILTFIQVKKVMETKSGPAVFESVRGGQNHSKSCFSLRQPKFQS